MLIGKKRLSVACLGVEAFLEKLFFLFTFSHIFYGTVFNMETIHSFFHSSAHGLMGRVCTGLGRRQEGGPGPRSPAETNQEGAGWGGNGGSSCEWTAGARGPHLRVHPRAREPHLLLGLCVALAVFLLEVPVVVVGERGGAGEAPRGPELPQAHSCDPQQRQGPRGVDAHLPVRGALDDYKAKAASR